MDYLTDIIGIFADPSKDSISWVVMEPQYRFISVEA